MQTHELRKLITTFLVLALLAGSASLAITSLARHKSEGASATTPDQVAGSQVPKIGDQALVEDIASTRIEGYDLAAEFTPSSDPGDNFTDGLAKGLAYNFVKANPEGPDADTGIAAPTDLQNIVDDYVTDAALSPTTYAIDETRVQVAKNYTPRQVDEYFATLEDVFGSASSTTGIAKVAKLTGSEPDTRSMQAANFAIAESQERLYDAVVPAPAERLHRAALAYLELNRKLSDLDYTTDPLKAAVFATKFPELRAMEEVRLRAEAQNVADNAPQLFAGATEPFTIASLLGVHSAHAFAGVVSDPKHTIVSIINGVGISGTWSQMIVEWVRKVATQVLKNQIVGRIIQQTVRWVQGGGKPQFITNWKDFLKESGKAVADRFLTDLAPRLCENLSPFTTDFTRQALSPQQRDPLAPITCSLDQVVQNVKDFYEDFQSGGWLGLAAVVFVPQNSVWGSVIVAHDLGIQQAAEAQAASNASAQANQGFKSLKRCVNSEVVSMSEREAAEAERDPGYVRTVRCYDGGDEYERTCDVEMCAENGWQDTTPGGFVADQLSHAVGGTLDNVVNADDLTGLVAVLIDSAINRLTNFAIGGVLGLFSGSDGDPGNGTSTTSGGDTGSLAALKAQAMQLLDSNRQRVENTSSTNAAWPGLMNTTRPLVVSVGRTCNAYSADAEQRVGAMDRIAPRIVEDQGAIAQIGASIASTSAAITAAQDALTIASIVDGLDAMNSTIATLSTRVATRNGQMESLQGDAEADLENRACNVPLTTLDE